ncbi:MAG: hypothetical protein Q7J10_04790 [Methanosarcinaceae archaeon]|nr:hypothetical protein [Methanosarcinaceae archaeon]
MNPKMDKLNNIKWNYILFLAVGILSFYISGFLLGTLSETYGVGIHGFAAVSFMLFIYAVLLAAGLIISKERSLSFITKAFAISFAAMFLISTSFFAWSAYDHVNSKAISADLLQTAPDKFVVLTEQELDEYPVIREAITSQQPVKVDSKEWEQTYDFLGEKGSSTVKYGDAYYDIGFITA